MKGERRKEKIERRKREETKDGKVKEDEDGSDTILLQDW